MANEVSMRVYHWLDVSEAFHPLSHHGEDPEKIQRLLRVQVYHTERMAKFAQRLKGIRDGENNLLENAAILFGSNMANSDLHDADPVPSALLGHACRHASRATSTWHYPQDTPHANLLLTLLQRVGVPQREARRQHGRAGGGLKMRRASIRLMRCWLGAALRRRQCAGTASTPRCRCRARHRTAARRCSGRYSRTDVAEVKRLLAAGAKVDAAPMPMASRAMQLAAETGNTAIIQMLLNAGADVESPNAEGQTALMSVARTGNVEAAKLLLKHGAKVNAAEKFGGQTALMWAAARRHPEMVELLASKGADVNARAIVRSFERHITVEQRYKNTHTGGLTPLLYAVRENCKACVEVLIKRGANILLPDPDGIAPLTHGHDERQLGHREAAGRSRRRREPVGHLRPGAAARGHREQPT